MQITDNIENTNIKRSTCSLYPRLRRRRKVSGRRGGLGIFSNVDTKQAHMSDAPAGSLSHPHISLKTAKARSKSLFNLILMIARIGSLLSYGRQLIGLFWHFSPEHAMKVHCLWIAILSSMLRTIVLDQLPSVDLRRSPYSANKTEHAGWVHC